MSISAQPYKFSGLTPLKSMFDALGLSGPPIVIVSSETESGLHESEALNLKPGERSLKARILTLIENNRPNIAMDLMQKTNHDDREIFDALFFDVKEALEDNGYDKDASELEKMAQIQSIEEPEIDYQAAQTRLVLG